MSNKNKGIVLALTTLLALLIGLVGFEAAGYTPSFCARCHRLDVAAWKTSTHARVGCSDCHGAQGALSLVTSNINQASMLMAGTVGAYEEPIIASVSNTSCLSCHENVRKGIVSRYGIRMRHSDVLSAGFRCTGCHNAVAHRKSTADAKAAYMETCVRCHDGEKASSECELCHESKVERNPTVRLAPWAVTHGEKWSKTHGMGNLSTCVVCHEEKFCNRCHGMHLPHASNWPRLHGKAAIWNRASVSLSDKARSCTGCHRSSYCDGCHAMPMPHPSGFLAKHKTVYRELGARTCDNCHIRSECNQCHVKHTHPGKLRDPLLTDEARKWFR